MIRLEDYSICRAAIQAFADFQMNDLSAVDEALSFLIPFGRQGVSAVKRWAHIWAYGEDSETLKAFFEKLEVNSAIPFDDSVNVIS